MGLTVSGFDSSSISTLFSGLPKASSGNNMFMSTTNMLGDYYSIRNGSYHRLLKSYYEMDKPKVSVDKTDKKEDLFENKATELKELKADATNLSEAATKLLDRGENSVFNKKSVADTDGKLSYQYDTDKIYKAIRDFADEYNDMIKSGGESDISSVNNAVSHMMRSTASNKELLGKIGIQIGTNGDLSIDEATFKKSDMTIAKALFQSQGSYGYQVATKASMINNAAVLQASSGSYNNKGSISPQTLMNSFNSYI